jgi:hypothetical protein
VLNSSFAPPDQGEPEATGELQLLRDGLAELEDSRSSLTEENTGLREVLGDVMEEIRLLMKEVLGVQEIEMPGDAADDDVCGGLSLFWCIFSIGLTDNLRKKAVQIPNPHLALAPIVLSNQFSALLLQLRDCVKDLVSGQRNQLADVQAQHLTESRALRDEAETLRSCVASLEEELGVTLSADRRMIEWDLLTV